MVEQEVLKCKRILLTAREKQSIVNFDVFITRFCVQAAEKVFHIGTLQKKKNQKFDNDSAGV
jgi:hypothetical protein